MYKCLIHGSQCPNAFYNLFNNCCSLQISVSDTGSMTSQLSVSTYYGLVKLLSTCVTGSHTVAENLLQSGISGTLHNLLRRYSSLFNLLFLTVPIDVCGL